MKKLVLLLLAAICIAGLVFATACSDDDDKASCDVEAVTQKCSDEATKCAEDAGTDADAAMACIAAVCDCFEDNGCEIPDGQSCGE